MKKYFLFITVFLFLFSCKDNTQKVDSVLKGNNANLKTLALTSDSVQVSLTPKFSQGIYEYQKKLEQNKPLT